MSKTEKYFTFTLSCLIVLLLAQLASAQSKDELRDIITKVAIENNVDPDLALSIATVESKLNPNKRGPFQEVGVMQLHPEYHKISRNEEENIRTAMKYLLDLQVLCKDYPGWTYINCYNTGPHPKTRLRKPELFPYYVKVMETYSQIRVNRFLVIGGS